MKAEIVYHLSRLDPVFLKNKMATRALFFSETVIIKECKRMCAM